MYLVTGNSKLCCYDLVKVPTFLIVLLEGLFIFSFHTLMMGVCLYMFVSVYLHEYRNANAVAGSWQLDNSIRCWHHLPPCLTQGLFLVADHYEHQPSWSQGSHDSWLCLLTHLRSSGVMDSPQKHWAFDFFPTFIFTWVLGIQVKFSCPCSYSATTYSSPSSILSFSNICDYHKSHQNSKALFCKTPLSIVSQPDRNTCQDSVIV